MIQLPLQFVGSPKPAFIEEFWTPVGRNLWGEPLGRESMTGACHEDEGPICKLPDARFSLLRSSKLTIRDGKYSVLPSRRPPAQGRWLLSPETAELLLPVNRPFPTRQHDGRSHSIAPYSIIDFIVAQGADARILRCQTVVQFSDHFWWFALRINESIDGLPSLLVTDWNRLSADCDVVAHRPALQIC